MNESEELFYSDDASINRYYFYQELNSVNIFVEDVGKEFEYEEIFERLLPKNIKIECIFCSGGKPKLEEAFSIFKNDNEKCFFVADGDFDVALGREIIQSDNFVYLKKYNIESYLINKDAVINYMRSRLGKTKFETEQIIDYEKWQNTIEPYFKKIFSLHFIVQKHELGITNVDHGAPYFVDSTGFPNIHNYNSYMLQVQNFISDLDIETTNSLKILENVYGNEFSSYICGKYYIESLSRYLNTKPVKKKYNADDLKANLISRFDISQLQYLVDRINAYVN